MSPDFSGFTVIEVLNCLSLLRLLRPAQKGGVGMKVELVQIPQRLELLASLLVELVDLCESVSHSQKAPVRVPL